MNNVNNNEPLLRVVHLKQFFRLGNQKLKAVHDVSFEINKGLILYEKISTCKL